ncbi:MAG: response regulator [Janthinobacterium lividum]
MERDIRIVVADDHPLVVCALEQALTPYPQITLIGKASESGSLVELLDRSPCDVLLTDFSMPGGGYGDGISMLRFLRGRYPNMGITTLTMLHNPALIRNALGLGIKGFVSKSDDISHVGAALIATAAYQRYISPKIQVLLDEARLRLPPHVVNKHLTRRELEVLRLYLSGERITSIAGVLNRSIKTVSAQKSTAMRKLGAANDADLFEFASVNGLGPIYS